jgi:hypothetical protein
LSYLLPLILGKNLKYDAENWLLGSSSVRVFIHHTSSVLHADEVYPRELYVNLDDREEKEESGEGGEREIGEGEEEGEREEGEKRRERENFGKDICQLRERHQIVISVNLPAIPWKYNY